MGLREDLVMLEDAASLVCGHVPTDDELADASGIMRRVEVKLGDTRRSWEKAAAELPPIPEEQRVRKTPKRGRPKPTPVAQGEEFELVPTGKNVFSYNTPAIVLAVQDETEWSTLQVMLDAARAGALKFEWGYKKLERWLHDLRVPMRTAFEEVDDDTGTDGAMIGKVWKQTGVERVPILPEDRKDRIDGGTDEDTDPGTARASSS